MKPEEVQAQENEKAAGLKRLSELQEEMGF
jgi:hypothetical protein